MLAWQDACLRAKLPLAGIDAAGVHSCVACFDARRAGLRRVGWQLREIEKEGDGSFALLYDTPDGARTVCPAPGKIKM